jgi:hypothetical protein
MPRHEARLYARIWKDPDFLALPSGAQRLYMFLISQEDLTHCGVMPYRPPRWRKAAGLTVTEIEADAELLTAGPRPFIVVDTDTCELLIRTLIRNDEVWKQPNVMKSAREAAALVESPAIRAALLAELRLIKTLAVASSEYVQRVCAEFLADLEDPTANPSLNPSGNPSPEDHPDPSPEGLVNGSQGRGDGYGPVLKVSPNPKKSPTPYPRGRAIDPAPDQAPLLPVLPVPDLKPGEGGERTEQEPTPIDSLTAEIRQIRPEWAAKTILRVLADPEVNERPWPVVRAAALIVAKDRATRSIGRLREDGPWWSLAAASLRSTEVPGPPHCGNPRCDPVTRMIDWDGDNPKRCPQCGPASARVS